MGPHVQTRSDAVAAETALGRNTPRLTQMEWLLVVAIVGILGTIVVRPERSGRLVALFAFGDLIGIWAVIANSQSQPSSAVADELVPPRVAKAALRKAQTSPMSMRGIGASLGARALRRRRAVGDGRRSPKTPQRTAPLHSSRAA